MYLLMYLLSLTAIIILLQSIHRNVTCGKSKCRSGLYGLSRLYVQKSLKVATTV